MGKSTREKPRRLPEKLKTIRLRLELSQDEITHRLGLHENVTRSEISKYERGVREPSLLTLLAYAKAYGTSTDVLIDDAAELPELDDKFNI